MRKNIPAQTLLMYYLFIIFSQPMFAGDYSENISEDYLHLKLIKYLNILNAKKTYHTYTYI